MSLYHDEATRYKRLKFRDTSSLRSEFRTLIMLLTLVTAINNGGYSTLQLNFAENDKVHFDTTVSSDVAAVINALSAILMRDHRVVAAAVPDFPSCLPSTSFTLGGSGFKVYIMQDEDQGAKVGNLLFKALVPTKAKARRQISDNVVNIRGISRFNLISNDNWECLRIP